MAPVLAQRAYAARAALLAAVGLLLVGALALAAPKFPELTGRVVDGAGLLSATARAALSDKLAAHEAQTSNQVVVVTVPSLDGYDIADYGYQLGRHWEIGQKDRNNGVLLVVAPNERKVRIEVGYGLEGALTDVLSHDIIQNRILPAFRVGNYEDGIVAGTEAILRAIEGTYEPAPARSDSKRKIGFIVVVVMIFLFVMMLLGSVGAGARHYGGRRSHWGGYSSGGFSGGGGFGGGGFSGGGGSFGGGGASGGW